MGKDKDEKKSTEEPGSAASFVDPDARRNIATDSRSSTRSRAQSVTRSSTFDIGRIVEAVGSAHDKGAASSAKQIDLLHDALKNAHATIKDKDAQIDAKNERISALISQLGKLAEANVTQQLLEGKARLDETRVHEMYESARVAMKTFGPAAVPVLQRVGAFLLPAAGDIADKGDKSPRSCAIRTFAKLQDGSEVSTRFIQLLADFAEDDWPGTLMYLASVANAPAAQDAAAH